MQDVNLHRVCAIFETDYHKTAQEYLDAGWILLGVCSRPINNNDNPPTQLIYSLGKLDPYKLD